METRFCCAERHCSLFSLCVEANKFIKHEDVDSTVGHNARSGRNWLRSIFCSEFRVLPEFLATVVERRSSCRTRNGCQARRKVTTTYTIGSLHLAWRFSLYFYLWSSQLQYHPNQKRHQRHPSPFVHVSQVPCGRNYRIKCGHGIFTHAPFTGGVVLNLL